MRLCFILFLLLFSCNIFAQNHLERFESIDVQNYSFEIHINDSNNRIEGRTGIQIKFLKSIDKLTLDLIGLNDSTTTGMLVKNIYSKGVPISFSHINDQLDIQYNKKYKVNETANLIIEYEGIPADGLIISRNKFGDRTFFGDNWPNRARHWLPTVDHPSDKATSEFLVYAPEQYQVISNGILFETSNIENGNKLSHWKENTPISTKLMVIGVARFAVQYNNSYNGIQVSSWVFPQNREDGFRDYQYGAKSLNYFSELIGTYSYEKLAHVQSKTRYGGMENASCIFYSERSVDGENQQERLFAHETAHQWFGNSVTEQNWYQIWLSEGFATYLTHVYNQNFHGEEHFRDGLKKDRKRIIKYAGKYLAPIIDTTVTEYIRLLNTNSYQKASWFLHMLRNKLGDEVFFMGLQNYYQEFQNSTALTKDFLNVMENISGQDLDSYFQQWLWQPGHPKLKFTWRQKSNKKLKLKINQTQSESLFSFPIEIKIQYKNGDTFLKTIEITDRKTVLSYQLNNDIESIELDPNVKLLFESVQQ